MISFDQRGSAAIKKNCRHCRVLGAYSVGSEGHPTKQALASLYVFKYAHIFVNETLGENLHCYEH